MAIPTFIKSPTTSNPSTKVAANGYTLTLTQGIAAGNIVVVYLSFIPATATNVSAIADSKGNTYHILHSTGSSGSIGDCLAIGFIKTALVNTDTITFTGPNMSALAVTLAEFSNVAGILNAGLNKTVSNLDLQLIGATSSTNTPTSGAGTPTRDVELLLGLTTVLGPSGDIYSEDSDSVGGDTWHTVTKQGTTGGGATSNCTINAAYKITTSVVSETYNPVSLGGTARTSRTLLFSLQTGAALVFSPGVAHIRHRRAAQSFDRW